MMVGLAGGFIINFVRYASMSMILIALVGGDLRIKCGKYEIWAGNGRPSGRDKAPNLK